MHSLVDCLFIEAFMMLPKHPHYFYYQKYQVSMSNLHKKDKLLRRFLKHKRNRNRM